MRYLIIAIGVFSVLLVSSGRAHACSCLPPGTPCDSYGSAAAVFVGTAVSVQETERKKSDPDQFDLTPRTFKFAVAQSYLGVEGKEVEVSTGRGGGDCGYGFRIGERYLVYAYREESRLVTGICTRTKPFAQSNEDLAFLDKLSAAPEGVTISGQVRHSKAAKGDSPSIGPDVVVIIESGTVRKEVRPDAQGRYRVCGLPAGKFKVTLQLPEPLITDRPEQELSVRDRGCATVDFYFIENAGAQRQTGLYVKPLCNKGLDFCFLRSILTKFSLRPGWP